MTRRQRWLETLTFGHPDKVAFEPGRGRRSTLKRWHAEGLPETADPERFVLAELGIDTGKPDGPNAFFIDFRMIPTFKEEVLEHRDGHYIVRDWMGAITEISDEYDYTYIRNAIDFVTRKWHKFPVETRDDWADMKRRYDPDDPARLPEDLPALAQSLKARTAPLSVSVNGPFWQLREWMGMENLCMAFIDQPEFVAEMIEFWSDFVERLLGRLLAHMPIDGLHVSEDMAYKAHSMISPGMTREFLQPVYRKWTELLKKHGVPIIAMDSDGYIGELIPIWIESGFNVCDPIEVAAHNDIVRFREQFGTSMAYRGGIDKRAIAAGGKALRDEIARVSPVIRSGGYIPGCDHGIPHDVSFEHYKAYVKLLAQATGWL